jgi:uncharacterized protein YndB with AHSA1/START domain
VSGTVTATARHRFETLDADAVYDAWLDADALRRWMARPMSRKASEVEITRVDIDARIGGRFHFAEIRDGEVAESWGDYRALERPSRIVFAWFVTAEEEQEDKSEVTIEIVPDGRSCVATISHEMDAQWAEYVEPTARAWASMLQAIDDTLAPDAKGG